MVRYAVGLVLVWWAAYGLIGLGVDLAMGQDDPPPCMTGLDGSRCCDGCECRGCKCDLNAGRKCCEGCGCVFFETCCCCKEPPVFVVPPDPVPMLPGIKKLPDGTYDLTAFFKAELKKKEDAAKCVVCGVGCCCCENCQCQECDCGCPVLKPHPVKEPTVKRERRRLFGASGRFRFRRH